MQFPVPQFTEVEDKIIGPLTLKQFGIIFGVGIVVFLGYSSTKSILVVIFLFLLFGVPGLGLAFVPFNGRPMYNSLGKVFKFFSSPKVLIFHKETKYSTKKDFKDAQLNEVKIVEKKPVQDTQANLKQIQELLRKTATEENEIVNKM